MGAKSTLPKNLRLGKNKIVSAYLKMTPELQLWMEIPKFFTPFLRSDTNCTDFVIVRDVKYESPRFKKLKSQTTILRIFNFFD